MSSSGPLAIEVRNVSKEFHIPGQRSALAPGQNRFKTGRVAGRQLQVLDDVSFDIHKGEFFGIVGRNGSGKSTLLKLLASVYRSDGGRIRIAGRLAPILELGVGFNQELPAYDNVIMSSVMMGLTPREARRRYDEIIDFAGLGDYTDLKLKNYSSGMKVRLGFAVVVNVDADILLIDEVLAVGDVEFQQKCGDVFGDMHRRGRTVVLVTHNMPTVSIHCERALLLHQGRIEQIGEPPEVVNRYLELNLRASLGEEGEGTLFRERFANSLAEPSVLPDEIWLEDGQGRRAEGFGLHQTIELHQTVEVRKPIEDPSFNYRIDNEHGEIIFIGDRAPIGGENRTVEPGEKLHVKVEIENRLAPGRYVVSSAVSTPGPAGPGEPAGPVATMNFSVGGDPSDGMVSLRQQVSSERTSAEGQAT